MVQAAAEYLIINCLNADIFLSGRRPGVDHMLRIFIGNPVAVILRGEGSIGFQGIFGGRSGLFSVGQTCQPIAHGAEIHGDGAVGINVTANNFFIFLSVGGLYFSDILLKNCCRFMYFNEPIFSFPIVSFTYIS